MFPSFIPVYLSQHLPLFSLQMSCTKLIQPFSSFSCNHYLFFSTNHTWNYFNKIQTRHINSFQDILIENYTIEKIVLLKKVQPCPHNLALSKETVVQYPSSSPLLYISYPPKVQLSHRQSSLPSTNQIIPNSSVSSVILLTL